MITFSTHRMKSGTKKIAAAALLFWSVVFAAYLVVHFSQSIAPGSAVSLFAAYAQADSSDGGDNGSGAGGGNDSGGGDGGGADGGDPGSGAGGGCGDCGGATSDFGSSPSADFGGYDFGGSEAYQAYVPYIPQVQQNWIPYCTGGDDPNGNRWQWWEKTTNTNPIQYRFVRMGDGVCAPAVPPPVCPTGTTGVYPNCVTPQPLCPQGTTGTYPNCVVPQPVCPTGTTGTYPHCVVPTPHCPTGTTGVYPHCVVPVTHTNNVCVGTNNCNTTIDNHSVVNANTTYTNNSSVSTVTNTNTNTNTNINTNTYIPPIYNYIRDYVYPQPHYPTYQYPTCTLSVYPTTISYGQSARLYWSSNYTVSGWIASVGSVATAGSSYVYPSQATTYSATFTGQNGQQVTCSAFVQVVGNTGYYQPPVQPPYYPPAYQPTYPTYTNDPYVTLSAVPYTGLELGSYGKVLYWSFLILWCVFAAYLLAVRRVYNDMARWFRRSLFGGAVPAQVHTAHAEHHLTNHVAHQQVEKNTAIEAADPFIAAQLERIGAH